MTNDDDILMQAALIDKAQRDIARIERLAREDEKYRLMDIAAARADCYIFPPYRYGNITFADLDPDISPELTRICKFYASTWKERLASGDGLFFTSSKGIGKSINIAAIINEILEQGGTALFATIPQLIDRIKSNGYVEKADIYKRIAKVDFLVNDELDELNFNDSEAAKIIDIRYNSRKPLLITTNHSKEQIENPKDLNEKCHRSISRLAQDAIIAEKRDEDLRGRTREIKRAQILKEMAEYYQNHSE